MESLVKIINRIGFLAIILLCTNIQAQVTFGPQQVIENTPFAASITTQDIDCDGKNDVVIATHDNNGYVAWIPQLSNGQFGSSNIIDNQIYGQENEVNVKAFSLNENNEYDIFTSSFYSIAVNNTLSCSSYESADYYGAAFPQIMDFDIIDLDGDGWMDIVLASIDEQLITFNDHITWMKGIGDGTFNEPVLVTDLLENPWTVLGVDIDNDGDNDIVSGTNAAFPDKIVWYENDGFGNFSTESIISQYDNYLMDIIAADIDNDGDQDLLAAGSQQLIFFENDGNANFTKNVINSGFNYEEVIAIDLDADNDLDLVAATYEDIYWFENDGNSSFGNQNTVVTNVSVINDIHAADMDNDGDVDIVSASSTDFFLGDFTGEFAWYENLCGTTDTDSDGTIDCNDDCPTDPNKVAVGDCGCGVSDVDTDSDGTADCNDGCPTDPNKIAAGDCGCGVSDVDTDSDGTADCNDGCPNDPNKVVAGDCGCGVSDVDTDSDGTADCNDGCPTDPNKIAAGDCGCGVSDVDTDSDGTADCNDDCPTDPNKVAAGDCGCGVSDVDSDSDGTADCNDGCPTDPNKVAAGDCGCGVSDVDSDSDGVADCNDVCPGGDDTVDNNNNGVPDDCESCTYSTINFNNFDGGWGIWNDGGSDCRRSSKDANYAYSGNRCVRIRDNTSTSTATTDNLDLSGFEELTIDFTYYPRSMDNSNEDFWLQISTDGGASFTTVEEWNWNDEFVNNQRYFDQVVINGPFTSTTKLRFRCDASGNSDWIYLDDIQISGCGNGNNKVIVNEEEEITLELEEVFEDLVKVGEFDFDVYPNPFNESFKIELNNYEEEHAIYVEILSINGSVVYKAAHFNSLIEIDNLKIGKGVYFIKVVYGEDNLTKQLIKIE